MEKINQETFADSTLTMVADLELNHDVKFTKAETRKLISKVSELAMREWWNTKQGKRYLSVIQDA